MCKISVIMATYNRCESLKDTLVSLVKQEYDVSFDYEIIVVDNNSNDNTKKVAYGFMNLFNGKLKYLFEAKQGQVFALNKGIREAQGEIIAFIDDDVILHKAWLKNINKYFDSYPEIAGIGGKILPKFKYKQPCWLTLDSKYLLRGALNYYDYGNNAFLIEARDKQILGANMAFRKSLFEKHGLLRERIIRHVNRILLFPDTEFYRRIKDAGEKIMYAPEVLVEHVFDKTRINKRYFRWWYYYVGISDIIINPRKKERKICKLPVWLIKKITLNILKSLINYLRLNFVKSFYYEANLYFNLGQAKGYLFYERFKPEDWSKIVKNENY
jgi:glycosyltransferase involved in cell wall biosynthesis